MKADFSPLNLYGDDFVKKCKSYDELLGEFNSVHSLSRYKGDELVGQILDSIAPLELFSDELKGAKTAIDVGSGAGLPGLFLAMLMSECEWHLFEPIAKKASFLAFYKAEMGLKNLSVHTSKIEQASPFIADIISSRALSRAEGLIEICNGFYDEHTNFLLYKGSEYLQEKAELESRFKNAKIEQKSPNQKRHYMLIKGIK